jgi:hypothetical protein
MATLQLLMVQAAAACDWGACERGTYVCANSSVVLFRSSASFLGATDTNLWNRLRVKGNVSLGGVAVYGSLRGLRDFLVAQFAQLHLMRGLE